MLKKSTTKPICKYYNGCKKTNNYLQDLYAGSAMDVKKLTIIYETICGYCIFEMALWKL
jgi:hypothetical protein